MHLAPGMDLDQLALAHRPPQVELGGVVADAHADGDLVGGELPADGVGGGVLRVAVHVGDDVRTDEAVAVGRVMGVNRITASRHARRALAKGLLTSEKRGTTVYYRRAGL